MVRALFIALGAALIPAFSFMFLIFGLLLVLTAVQLFRHRDEDPDRTRVECAVTQRGHCAGVVGMPTTAAAVVAASSGIDRLELIADESAGFYGLGGVGRILRARPAIRLGSTAQP